MLYFEAKLSQIRFQPQSAPSDPLAGFKGKGKGENPLHYKFLATPLIMFAHLL